MKFQTHIHHLFDAIEGGRVSGGLSKETRAAWRDRLRRDLPLMRAMPLFVVRDAVDDVFEGGMMELTIDAWTEGRLTPPYPDLLVEFQVRDVVELDGSPAPDHIWVSWLTLEPNSGSVGALLFLAKVDDLRDWSVSPFSAHLWPECWEVEQAPVLQEDPDRFIDPAVTRILPEMLADTRAALLGACAVVLLLDSPAVEVERVKVPKEINRGRRILKRSPIPDHTVLRLPRLVHFGESEGTGTHRRPRCHWRRPHRREYRPGEWTDIPLTLVARRPDEPPPPPPVVEIVTHRKEPKP